MFSKNRSGSSNLARCEAGWWKEGWKDGRMEGQKDGRKGRRGGRNEGGSQGLEETPELQPRAQVYHQHFEDAQGWTSGEGVAFGGDKGGNTGTLTQHHGCTLIDPNQTNQSPYTPTEATVPTHKHPQVSGELLINQHPSPIMLPLTPCDCGCAGPAPARSAA